VARKKTGKIFGSGGSPRLRDAKTRAIVLKALRDGGSLEDAAAKAGVCHDVLYKERKQDESFKLQVEEAIVQGKLVLIRNAGKKNPFQMLAVRYPKEYGRKDRFALKDVVQLYDDWLEITLPFVPEERREAFKDQLNAKLTRLAVNAGVIPEDGSNTQ
jgi:hypothetical protein